jgi:putative PIN family toxin of toxin-antitoxin system
MTRVVFDANTIVSGFPASDGVLRTLIDHWRAGRFQLVVSEHILTEVARAWTTPYWQRRFPPERVALVLDLIRSEATVTSITVDVRGIATHPEDDLVLATAMSAGATVIVTGDRRLREVGAYQGVTIRTPREFVTLLEQQVIDQQ